MMSDCHDSLKESNALNEAEYSRKRESFHNYIKCVSGSLPVGRFFDNHVHTNSKNQSLRYSMI